jgi:hypothetical protein
MLTSVPRVAAVSWRMKHMKTEHLTVTVAVALLTGACGYSIKATSDYDHSVNFASYRTFTIMKGNSSGNPLSDQRISANVASALTSKGWREAPEGEAQAAVVVHTATKTKHTYQTFYDGWGGWGWRRRGWGGLGGSTTYEEDYKVGSVVVDIFDAKTKEAIWHGHATGVLSGKAQENAQINEQAVARMFASFPPGANAATSSGR